MTEVEARSWEEVRARGRGQFLLQGVLDAKWFLLGAFLVELCWWLVTGKLSKPPFEIVTFWLLVAIVSGAVGALVQWNTKEREYEAWKSQGAVH